MQLNTNLYTAALQNNIRLNHQIEFIELHEIRKQEVQKHIKRSNEKTACWLCTKLGIDSRFVFLELQRLDHSKSCSSLRKAPLTKGSF